MKLEQLAEVLEAVQVIALRQSDLLVFRTARRVSPAQEKEIVAYLKEKTDHERILVLDGGDDLALVRPENEPAKHSFWNWWST